MNCTARTTLALAASLLVLACSGEQGGDAPEEDATSCTGTAPGCPSACGSDGWYAPAVCEAGKWTCKQGVLETSCPPDTCWGAPATGEVCVKGKWTCKLDDALLAACPALACGSCAGVSAPVTGQGCTCACSKGTVSCKPPKQTCPTGGSTTLPGVSILFPPGPCTVTVAEAAAGLTIQYDVLVAEKVAGVVPMPQDGGQCGKAGPGGLIPFHMIAGGGQKYCLCDTGLCMPPSDTPVDLQAGTFSSSFDWDGVNWAGPSDTGNPKGKPFPPGSYTVTVSAKGTMPDGVGGKQPFEVVGTRSLTLVP